MTFSYPKFIMFFLLFVTLVFSLSYYLNQLDIPYTHSDALKTYQLNKLSSATNVNTVILGDSSAGNAVDAKVWSDLSGQRTLNLSLTARYGLTGTFNMLRHAHRQQSIQNVLIIYSFDLWHRPLSDQGYYETLYQLDSNQLKDIELFYNNNARPHFYFATNPKEIWWFIKYILHPKPDFAFAGDYISQSSRTFSSGQIIYQKKSHSLSDKIDPQKIDALELMDDFCLQNELNCFITNGPLLDKVCADSNQTISAIQQTISANTDYLVYLPNPYCLPARLIGDSLDHITPDYKPTSTQHYYELLPSQ